MIDDGIAKDVDVVCTLEGDNKIIAQITLTRNDDTQDVTYFDLWLNTVNNN